MWRRVLFGTSIAVECNELSRNKEWSTTWSGQSTPFYRCFAQGPRFIGRCPDIVIMRGER